MSNSTTANLSTTYIYGLFCPLTEELRYVGKTTNLRSRFNSHCSSKGNTYRERWIRSLTTQGLKPVMHVLEECVGNNWIESEQFHIAYFRSLGCKLCNLTAGGEGLTGKILSEETKQKISKAHTGKVISAEARVNMGKSRLGSKRTEETKQKLSKIHKGRVHTETARQNMRVGKGISYVVTTPTGEEVEISNLNRYCVENNLHAASMAAVVKGRRNHHKGYTVRYLDTA